MKKYFSEEHIMLRQMVREFAEKEIKPMAQEIDSNSNTITVGEKTSLFKNTCKVSDINWLINEPKFPYDMLCQIRYNGGKSKAVIKKESDNFTVSFSEPQLAITPGQSIVFYSDNILIGGVIIEL